MDAVWKVLGVVSTILFWCLALYALVFNPKIGEGDSRTLVLSIALSMAVVATFVLAFALFGD